MICCKKVLAMRDLPVLAYVCRFYLKNFALLNIT